jgi:hypothetical protein
VRRGRFSRALRGVVAAGLFFGGATACGPDAQSIGDSCPDLPLYRLVFDEDTATWKRVPVTSPDGGSPLGADDQATIAKAEAHCLTPAGNATGGLVGTPDAGAK